MDLDIHIRSNDILWGLTGVNIFEFTVLQELVAYMVNIPIGKYFHIADSLHYYTDYQKRMDNILHSPHFDIYDYTTPFNPPQVSNNDSLVEMDTALNEFMDAEKVLRCGSARFNADVPLKDFQNAMQIATKIIKRLPLPLPDICRCMLIYIALIKGGYSRMTSGSMIHSILSGMSDSAVKVGMIEWLTRQKTISKDFKNDVMKDIPGHLMPHIGNFIKKEENI